MQNKCSRFKVNRAGQDSAGVEIDTDCIPVANPRFSNIVARWFYENFPLKKGQQITVEYSDILGEASGSEVSLRTIVGDEDVLVLRVVFEEPGE